MRQQEVTVSVGGVYSLFLINIILQMDCRLWHTRHYKIDKNVVAFPFLATLFIFALGLRPSLLGYTRS